MTYFPKCKPADICWKVMSENKQLSIIEAFQARHSVRNYTGQILPEKKQLVDEIVHECYKITGPFGTAAEIDVTESGIGRLGFISNESGWIVLKIPSQVTDNTEYVKYCIDAAFKANIAVMKLTQHGIGTCWVGGTYSRSVVESRFPGFKIPCVVCFGLDADQSRFMDKVINFFKKSGRYEFPAIYYDEVAKAPVPKTIEGKVQELLECIRWLPSAVNYQSWRCTINTEESKFKIFDYYNLNNSYSHFDIGIFLSGFYFYTDGKCTYTVEDTQETFPSGGKYVCSVSIPKEILA